MLSLLLLLSPVLLPLSLLLWLPDSNVLLVPVWFGDAGWGNASCLHLVRASATQNVAPLFYFCSLLAVSLKEEKKPPPPVPKKPAKSKAAMSRDKASDAGDKQRQEARKRLLAAKRAASVRQNSATESADSIEIYVPEAQTRL